MHHLPTQWAVRAHLHLLAALRRRNERGDVPGWVLITVMTVGLVSAITVVARDQLTQLLRAALNSVN